jgi:hypothetical protein
VYGCQAVSAATMTACGQPLLLLGIPAVRTPAPQERSSSPSGRDLSYVSNGCAGSPNSATVTRVLTSASLQS